jgi:2-oxoglutarate dehydrogenase complex dehydrogenase (E1) component-like enzyme
VIEKPMVVFTPKSLLRHPSCVSGLQQLAEGGFEPVLDDAGASPARVRRVVLCSGKLYYDLLKGREEARADHVALVRLEQLAPFPSAELERVLGRYSPEAELVWAQEEPRNMGAWRFVRDHFTDGELKAAGNRTLGYVGRAASAAPAPGAYRIHLQEQEAILAAVVRA